MKLQQGQIWKKDNEPLAEAQNSIARFLRAGTYEQPEKIQYRKNG